MSVRARYRAADRGDRVGETADRPREAVAHNASGEHASGVPARHELTSGDHLSLVAELPKRGLDDLDHLLLGHLNPPSLSLIESSYRAPDRPFRDCSRRDRLTDYLQGVWAVALGKSEGFSRLTPSLVFLVGIVLSMGGLAYALRTLPIGTGYAVWVGVGAALTVVYGMLTGAESVTAVKVLLLAGLVGCVIGLKLAH